MAIILSMVDRFSKSFHYNKEDEIFNNSYKKTSTTSFMGHRVGVVCPVLFSVNFMLFSNSQSCICEPPYGGIRGNISALSKSFNEKKLLSKVSSRESVLLVKQQIGVSEPPFKVLRRNVCDSSLARLKAPSRHHISYNWTFFASAYSWDTPSEYVEIRVCWRSLRLNIRSKGYVYRQHP